MNWNVSISTFYVFSKIWGFAKKTKKIHTVWQKPRNVTKFQIVTLWHLEMSPNVTNVTISQIFGTKLRLPFIFGSGSERLVFSNHEKHTFFRARAWRCGNGGFIILKEWISPFLHLHAQSLTGSSLEGGVFVENSYLVSFLPHLETEGCQTQVWKKTLPGVGFLRRPRSGWR